MLRVLIIQDNNIEQSVKGEKMFWLMDVRQKNLLVKLTF